MHSLFQVVETCERLLNRAGGAGRYSSRTFYGHGLFLKATIHGRSMLELVSSSKSTDAGAICVLARCIMEIHNAATYFLEERLSKDEAHMRLHLFLLNHSANLKRIHDHLGTAKSDFWVSGSVRWSVTELEKNPVFAALDEPHRKNLLRGKSPYLYGRYSGSRLVSKTVESGLYTLFSQSTHSFSLGLPAVEGGQFTPAGTESSLLLAADTGALYMSSLALMYWRLRHRAIKKITAEERAFLQEHALPASLMMRLSDIKSQAAVF